MGSSGKRRETPLRAKNWKPANLPSPKGVNPLEQKKRLGKSSQKGISETLSHRRGRKTKGKTEKKRVPLEKKNPTKMDTSEKERGDATIRKKGDPKRPGKKGVILKTLKTLEKHPP